MSTSGALDSGNNNSGSIVAEGSRGSGDWICDDLDCRHLNFARRTKCNKCQRERMIEPTNSGSNKKKLGTEIGKVAAEKSRGLFSAEDWQCSKCGNVNWARRQTCNMCNAPKFCDVEERTGYGGGYNDRGVVEYKDRSESDGEYDEYGRLKKRKHKDSSDNELQHKKNRPTYDDEDDDEDEDDGDADLSKYDLWGDDDNENPSKNNKEPQSNEKGKNSTRSHTRSHSSRSSSSSSSYTSSSRSSGSSTSSSSTSKSRSRSSSANRKSTRKVENSVKDKNSSDRKIKKDQPVESAKSGSLQSNANSSRCSRSNSTSRSSSSSAQKKSSSSSMNRHNSGRHRSRSPHEKRSNASDSRSRR